MIFTGIDKMLGERGSIYKLTILAAMRATELNSGATRLVDVPLATKPTTVALQEIREGKIAYREVEPKEDSAEGEEE